MVILALLQGALVVSVANGGANIAATAAERPPQLSRKQAASPRDSSVDGAGHAAKLDAGEWPHGGTTER